MNLNSRLILIIALVVGGMLPGIGATLKIDDFEIYLKESADVGATVTAQEGTLGDFSGFQFDLVLPEGITVSEVEKGSQQGSFIVRSSTLSNGNVRVVGYADDNSSETPGTVVANITFEAHASTPLGTKKAEIKNLILSSPEGSDLFLDDSEFEIDVRKRPLLGDSDDNGYVNVTDAVVTINYILEQPVSSWNFTNADVDFNKIINVSDVVGIISIILEGK